MSDPPLRNVHVIVIRGHRFGLPVAECIGLIGAAWANRPSVDLPIPPERFTMTEDPMKMYERPVVVRLERGPTRYLPAGELPFVSDEREALDVAVNAVTFVCRSDDVTGVDRYIRAFSA